MPDGMFAGRDAELDQLRAALALARTGNGSTFVIAGEPGIGKSRLAREFGKEASAHGTLVVWGRGAEGPVARAYAPWSDIFETLIPDRNVAPDLTRALEPITPHLEATAADSEQIALDSEQARVRLFDAAQQLIGRISAKQVLVAIIDDIQWADAASLDLTRHLAWFAPRSAFILILLERTGEPDRNQARANLDALRSENGVKQVQLQGLSALAVAQMLGPDQASDSGMVRHLTEQTSGNPFFIEEIVRNVSPDRTSDPAFLDVPANIRTAVERRLARLSEAARSLLSAAALFPNGVDFPVLQRLTDLGDDALLDGLDEALASRILFALPGRSERYAFAHAIVRQTLYESWNPSRRVRAHRRAAQALEEIHAGRADGEAGEIAFQFHHSQTLPDAELGLPYALEAVAQSRRSLASDQVVAFLRIARDLADRSSPFTLADILGQLTVAEAETVQVDESTATLETFLLQAERCELDRIQIAIRLNELARALKYSAYAEERTWRPVVERGLALTAPEDGTIWARLKLLLDPVEPLSRSGIKVGRWLGFEPEATDILRSKGDEDDFAHSVESFDAWTRTESDAYLTRVRGFTSVTAVMYGLTVAANHLQYRHGAFRDAHRLWLELVELSERAGAIHWEQQATNQLTYLMIAEGRFDEAVAFEERSNALATRLGPGQHSEGHQLEMATCRAIYQGSDWQEIAQSWRAMLDDPALGPHDLSTLTGAFYAALAAYSAAQADDHGTALRLLEMLEPIVARMGPRDCNHNGTVAFTVGAAWKLNAAGAAPMYRQLATELLTAGEGDYPQSSIHLALGQASALLGRLDDARAAFALARQTVSESGQAPMAPIVDFVEAEALWRSGSQTNREDIQSLMARAKSGFDQYAMTPWLIDHQVLTDEIESQSGKGTPLPGAITEREADVLRLIARGYSDRQISDELFVSPRTVNAHVRNMLSKTGVSNRVELAMWARTNGIVSA